MMKFFRRTALASALWLAGLGSAIAAETGHVLVNEDLRHIRALAAPRLSPDGRQVLVQITDATADGGLSHLWLVDIASNASRQLTWTPAIDKRGEHNGRWAPGGEAILFLAKRGDHAQLFRLPMAGGEARAYDLKIAPVVDESADKDAIPPRKAGDKPAASDPIAMDVDDFDAAPDGRTIAILARDPETPGEKKQHDDKADAVWQDHDQHGVRLYLLDAASEKLTAVALSPDVKTLAWSAKGDRLIAITRAPNDASDLGPANSVWLVSPGDPAHPARLAELPPTLDNGAWSEDGARFYFPAQAKRDAPPGYSDLYVLTLADKSIKDLTDGFAGSVDGVRPIPLVGGVLQAAELGASQTYLRLAEGKLEPIAFDAPAVTQLDTNARRTGWVWLGGASTHPDTLYFANAPGHGARVLNTPSQLTGGWAPVASRPVHWRNEGLTLEGLLYLPPLPAGGRAPLIVSVHGGPTGAWHDTFDPLTNFLVAQGWAVLRPNPRGSSGYGAAFAAANKNDLGGADYRDLMAGVDAVIGAYPIDPGRLALIGYSYGGEMAGFVEGKTDRFKAIVSGAPVIDQESEYGTESGSWYDRWFYGKPWDHAEDAWRQSPLATVAHAKTPFLLLQGDDDKTDPLGQSLEMYRALRQVGVPVQLVHYPREDHGPLSQGMRGGAVTEPWHGFDARQRIVKFIGDAFDKASVGK